MNAELTNEFLNRVTEWADIDREHLGIPMVFQDTKIDAASSSVYRLVLANAITIAWAAHDEPLDPLDAFHDGLSLRCLLNIDDELRREVGKWSPLTPNQRAAVSAHWSAQLRAKVDATKQAEQAQVVCDWQDEP